ncbi:uncharacterized protein DEA37_0014488 [Paragonimus westermani]|uniref:Uncharacterized protein n=1 Tax=Paragonimus westermani TaxID=34504 RepID=A0A5J4NUG6_9TREM|nr:uncharacterized protein DEA37_0014488 [Paragonimus westermani]
MRLTRLCLLTLQIGILTLMRAGSAVLSGIAGSDSLANTTQLSAGNRLPTEHKTNKSRTDIDWLNILNSEPQFGSEVFVTVMERLQQDLINASTQSSRKTRWKRRVAMNSVRVKLQAFIFEVQIKRLEGNTDAVNHLKQLMNRYAHLPLDPQYTEKVITGYNPLVMQDEVCKEFEDISPNKHVANSFFVVNDVGTFVPRPLHDRLHRLFFQITSALGMPSITWLPNRVGQFEDEDSLATAVRRWRRPDVPGGLGGRGRSGWSQDRPWEAGCLRTLVKCRAKAVLDAAQRGPAKMEWAAAKEALVAAFDSSAYRQGAMRRFEAARLGQGTDPSVFAATPQDLLDRALPRLGQEPRQTCTYIHWVSVRCHLPSW